MQWHGNYCGRFRQEDIEVLEEGLVGPACGPVLATWLNSSTELLWLVRVCMYVVADLSCPLLGDY